MTRLLWIILVALSGHSLIAPASSQIVRTHEIGKNSLG